MTFVQLNHIARQNHETQMWVNHSLFLSLATSKRLREMAEPRMPSGVFSPSMTEAFEMNAAKHGLPFGMPLFGLTPEIRVQIDDNLPEGTWRLVSPDGTIECEGTLD